MKKVLFLTTALIATGSMAAADVRISGYGRFGLDYNEANAGNETNITSRLRLQFDMTTETDGGVTLGARVRMQAENRDGAPGGVAAQVASGSFPGSSASNAFDNGFNGARFFASFGGFQVGVGNILTAVEAMQGLYLETKSAGVGIDGSGFSSVVANLGGTAFSWAPFTSDGQGTNGVEVIYNGANWGAHLSYVSSDYCVGAANAAFYGVNGGVAGCVAGADQTAIAAYYTFGDWTAAIAYNDIGGVPAGTDNDLTVFTLQGDLGFAGVRLAYAEIDNVATTSGDASKLGLYGIFDIGAATNMIVFVTDEDAPGLASDGTGYGIHVSHDLGGGASIEAGWVESSADNTTVQAGVFFSF